MNIGGGQGPRARGVASTLAGVLLLLAGCGAGGGAMTITNQPLAGKIGGQAFALGTAQSDAFLSRDATFFVIFYGTTFTACASGAEPIEANEVIVELPKTVGSYNLSLEHNATFYGPGTMDKNLIATQGTISIDSVTATTITGGAHVVLDGDNVVDGLFTATVCPEP